MIIPLNIIKQNNFYKIYHKLEEVYNTYCSTNIPPKTGRPRLYSDLQIIACFLYKTVKKIFCLRELEYELSNDFVAQKILGLTSVPDHSTFCIRFKDIEKSIFYQLFRMLTILLQPDVKTCAIDSTALRSSKYDSQAKKSKSTRLGWYYGYKLHCICSNDSIPIAFEFSTANVYDNNCEQLMKSASEHNIGTLLGDAAYDAVKLFKLADSLSFQLLTDINLRKSRDPENIQDEHRKRNHQLLTSPDGESLYKRRITIERLFSTLKLRYNLENSRLCGFNRYKTHVMWVLMLYLIEKLIEKPVRGDSNKFPWNN